MTQRPRNRFVRICLLSAVASCALSGCKVGPDYHAPELKLPGSFAATPEIYGPQLPKEKGKQTNTKIAPVDVAQWWKVLDDETLNGLIDRAIKANPQLEIALT